MKTVTIGSKKVPLVEGKTVAYFSSGEHGEREAGEYCFWAAVCIVGKKATPIFGRALSNLDAGERFRRIGKETKSAPTAADRKVYSKHWKMLKTVVYVRPATVIEVSKWLVGHEADAEFLKSVRYL